MKPVRTAVLTALLAVVAGAAAGSGDDRRVVLGFEAQSATPAPGPRPPVRVPRTEFDTAHRFTMDSRRKLTAAEFDAWLASMGARVVGAGEGAATNPAQAPSLPDRAMVAAAENVAVLPGPIATPQTAPIQLPLTWQPGRYTVID